MLVIPGHDRGSRMFALATTPNRPQQPGIALAHRHTRLPLTNHLTRSGRWGVRRSGIKEEPHRAGDSRGAECRAGLIQRNADLRGIQKEMGPRLREDDGAHGSPPARGRRGTAALKLP